MLFVELCRGSESVAAVSKRSEKTSRIAGLLREAATEELAVVVAFLVGAPRQGRIGIGWAQLRDVPDPTDHPQLSVADVDRAIDELAALSGTGSIAARRARLAALMQRATTIEQDFLRSVIGGELRQGASEGVMAAAIGRAAGVAVASVQRAAMMSGDLGETARVAMTEGSEGLSRVLLTPLRAVSPMLASSATDVGDALARTGEALVEWKLDGARIQAHRRGDDVVLFTRNLNDVTDRLGGVVAAVRSLAGGDLVLDGEVLGVSDEGLPLAFQDTMGDFGADGSAGRGLALGAYFFDVLHVGADTVVDEPLSARRDLLASVVPEAYRLPSVITSDPDDAAAVLAAAVAAGHEGVVVKALDSSYDAGRRGGAWRKVKPVHTLDLVVLAAEWGHGRRTGWLSNLHLGARGDDGDFVMVGKTFKGLTDELLRWQTDMLQRIAIGSERHVVHVEPRLVVEVALDGVQRSTRYEGGVALRFARVRRYRDDKAPSEADTIDAVRAMFRSDGAG